MNSERIPDFHHKASKMSIARFYREAQCGARVCNIVGFPIEGVQAYIAHGREPGAVNPLVDSDNVALF